MLERGNPTLSIRGQCRLLGIARSGVYWRAAANDDEDLPLMLRIDALFTAWPFLGSRRMTAMLRADGLTVNRKRVQRLMRRMGIAALGPKPRTTKPAPGHKIFPYLLRDLRVRRRQYQRQHLRRPECWPGHLARQTRAGAEEVEDPRRRALFQGNSISLGGLLPKTDLDAIKASLQSIFGTRFTFGALPDDASAWFGAAKDKTLAALAGLKSPASPAPIWSRHSTCSIINFETGSAAISSGSRDLLTKAAATMKQLPAGTVIEISGHTDSTGDPSANLTLSQQRADAVRITLINLGVPADALKAKGYGDTEPVASNDTAECWFQNRRISYAVVH